MDRGHSYQYKNARFWAMDIRQKVPVSSTSDTSVLVKFGISVKIKD